MKKILKMFITIIGIIAIAWIGITIWVQAEGKSKIKKFGINTATKKALIIYDPDPFYNLDEQVCESFASVLVNYDWQITIATVKAAKKINTSSYDLYVFCANTYNWDPDWAISKFIQRSGNLYQKNVVAITLGAGATKRSQKALEMLITGKSSRLLGSKSYWLLKPNDESEDKESNVKIANELVKKWAIELNKSIDFKLESI